MKSKMNVASRLWLLFGALQLIPVLFMPFWKIQLIAPQYPEGLEMKIWTNKLSGDVDIINGLNHYIGMQKIVESEFIEFKILPIMLVCMVLLGGLVALLNRRTLLFGYVGLFMLISLVSLADFYRWEYQYGHNLDPTAPIQVPGMAYQPPLIGYKQLLNFLAFSFPDVGGFLYAASGVFLVIALTHEIWIMRKQKLQNKLSKSEPMNKSKITVAGMMLLLVACAAGPQPIKYGSDSCEYCKMSIVDKRFAGEVATTKGKVYKFDDLRCVVDFLHSPVVPADDIEGTYINTYDGKNEFVRVEQAQFTKAEALRSPMGGNVAAFKDAASRDNVQREVSGVAIMWNEINKK